MSPGVAVIVQARTSSTRLPGKVLRPLAGAPAIVRMLERVGRVRCADHVAVATSDDPSDDELARVCREHGIAYTRGPLHDVLGRVSSALPEACDVVVRLTGDCPLVDPALVDAHVRRLREAPPGVDYVSNAVARTYPDGLDVEVLTRSCLLEASRQAIRASDREHVTPWVQRHARRIDVMQPVDLSELRWTLDTAEDYATIAAMFDELFPVDPRFGADDVYRLLLRRPELIRIAGRETLDAGERAIWVARIRSLLAAKSGGS